MPKTNIEENAPHDDPDMKESAMAEDSGLDDPETLEENEQSGIELIEPDPRIGELEAAMTELQGRLRAVSAAYKQQQDEMAATRSRLQRQSALREEVRRGEVVAEIFEPVQNIQRSIDAAKKGSSMEDLVQGLEMLHGQFLEAFGKLGLEEVPGKGTRFDPNLHEALSMIPVPESALDGIIIEVFSAGYRIGQRLITPARVIVGQGPEETPEQSSGQTQDNKTDREAEADESHAGEPVSEDAEGIGDAGFSSGTDGED